MYTSTTHTKTHTNTHLHLHTQTYTPGHAGRHTASNKTHTYRHTHRLTPHTAPHTATHTHVYSFKHTLTFANTHTAIVQQLPGPLFYLPAHSCQFIVYTFCLAFLLSCFPCSQFIFLSVSVRHELLRRALKEKQENTQPGRPTMDHYLARCLFCLRAGRTPWSTIQQVMKRDLQPERDTELSHSIHTSHSLLLTLSTSMTSLHSKTLVPSKCCPLLFFVHPCFKDQSGCIDVTLMKFYPNRDKRGCVCVCMGMRVCVCLRKQETERNLYTDVSV